MQENSKSNEQQFHKSTMIFNNKKVPIKAVYGIVEM